MDFTLTAEHETIRQLAHNFAKKEIEPLVPEIERTGEHLKIIWDKMAKLGLFGIPYAKEYGGQGADFLSFLVALEEVAVVSSGIAASTSVQVTLAAGAIDSFGSHEQKLKYLSPLASGEKIGFFATTEPNASSDPKSIETHAVPYEEGFISNGQKCMITNGGIADYGVVFAKTSPGKLSAFIVERNMPGFTSSKPEELMGNKGQQIFELYMDNVFIPEANLLGELGKGMSVALSTLDSGRIGIAAEALGVARAALEESIKYVRERKQFGAKLATFQALQFDIADMATALNAARWLTYHAAFLKQTGQYFSKEAAMAKCFATEASVNATRKAVQIHGGYGYMKRYKVERLYRDAKIPEIYEGTSEIMRIIISRNIIGSE